MKFEEHVEIVGHCAKKMYMSIHKARQNNIDFEVHIESRRRYLGDYGTYSEVYVGDARLISGVTSPLNSEEIQKLRKEIEEASYELESALNIAMKDRYSFDIRGAIFDDDVVVDICVNGSNVTI